MSDRQNVITPVGSVAPQPARSRSTSSPGVAGPPRRVGRQAAADRGLELLGLRGVDALPRRQHAGRRRAGEQREGRRGQRVDVARARRRRRRRRARARGSPAVPLRRRERVGADDSPKSTSLTRPPLGEDQVGRLDVAVDDRRVLRVQVGQRLGGLGEVGEHARRRQARAAAVAQQARRGRCRRPSPSRRRSCRRRRSPRGPAAAPGAAGGRAAARASPSSSSRASSSRDRADLQRDDAVVLAVERLDHAALAARRPSGSSDLVAVLDRACAIEPLRPSYAWRRGVPQIEVMSGRAQLADRAGRRPRHDRQGGRERRRARPTTRP